MPYRKFLGASLDGSLGWLQGLLVVVFAVNPQFVVTLAALFALEVFLGTQTARERGAPIRYRDYARAKYYELVRLGSWLAVVLWVTNLDPGLIHLQRYILIATAAGLGGRIVRRHLGGVYTRMWVEVEGKILHTASREVETPDGQPNLIERTIVTERPGEAPPPSLPPGTSALVVLLVSALVLAACAAPFLIPFAP